MNIQQLKEDADRKYKAWMDAEMLITPKDSIDRVKHRINIETLRTASWDADSALRKEMEASL